jgi:hypothetical protein
VESNWLSRHKYQLLLLAVALLLVAYPILRGPAHRPLVARSLITIMFLIGGWITFTARLRIPAVLFGAPALLGVWAGAVLPEEHGRAVTAGFHTAAMLFQSFVIAALLLVVYRERTVSGDGVAAALCGYILIGVVFGHVYCLVELAVPQSFRGLEPGASDGQTHFLLSYFSFITLTTVGYGDITPSGDSARSLALVEGVAGQFYLAVLVAELVGKRVAQALSPPSPSGD